VVGWVIGKKPNVLLIEQKRQIFRISPKYLLLTILISLFACMKRKLRKNTTKGWFSKEASTSVPPTSSTSPPHDNVGASLPPRVPKKVVRKMTTKKKIGN
jgi:hypothetical protein